MGFAIEHECPQCGALITLEETDRLIHCRYCAVTNFLIVRDHPRFLLPHKAPDQDIIYAPYIRFKGEVYFCSGISIGYHIVDITHQATAITQLPISLGIRPQTMKMKFVTPDTSGSFIKCSLTLADVLTNVGRRGSLYGPETLLHRAYIGEVVSIIYLPLFEHEGMIFDAVVNRPIITLPEDEDIRAQTIRDDPRRQITFMAALCPQCGWDLKGERDSVVLTCTNCDTAWEALGGRFVQVSFKSVLSKDHNAHYLPFWRLVVQDEVLQINSYADFVRVTGQPLIVRTEWEVQDMSFWIPAFKIRPEIFLRLTRQMSIHQNTMTMEDTIPSRNLYPVTLPKEEAAQGLKIALASSAVAKEGIFPLLPNVNFIIRGATLTWLPFTDLGNDILQEQMGVNINKNALKFGRSL